MSDKKIVRARDVMSKNVLTIDGMATASEAATLMKKEQVPALLVENPCFLWHKAH